MSVRVFKCSFFNFIPLHTHLLCFSLFNSLFFRLAFARNANSSLYFFFIVVASSSTMGFHVMQFLMFGKLYKRESERKDETRTKGLQARGQSGFDGKRSQWEVRSLVMEKYFSRKLFPTEQWIWMSREFFVECISQTYTRSLNYRMTFIMQWLQLAWDDCELCFHSTKVLMTQRRRWLDYRVSLDFSLFSSFSSRKRPAAHILLRPSN